MRAVGRAAFSALLAAVVTLAAGATSVPTRVRDWRAAPERTTRKFCRYRVPGRSHCAQRGGCMPKRREPIWFRALARWHEVCRRAARLRIRDPKGTRFYGILMLG
jgi:hypothetical protein